MSFQSTMSYISPLVVDIFRLLRNKARGYQSENILLNNRKWQNFYANEKVFIIANGPSLSKIDRKLFKGQKVIVMNSFEKAIWKDEVDIVAHCYAEPYCSSAWSKEHIIESISGTNSKSYWLDYSSNDKLNKCGKKHLFHYVLPLYEANLWGKKQIHLHKPSLVYQTTAQLSIMVAFYMGFSEIALLGFDHDWLASRDYARHFFSNEKEDTDKLGEMSYLDIINFMQRMWQIYYKLEENARLNNISIYNLSTSTYLDVFERREATGFILGES